MPRDRTPESAYLVYLDSGSSNNCKAPGGWRGVQIILIQCFVLCCFVARRRSTRDSRERGCDVGDGAQHRARTHARRYERRTESDGRSACASRDRVSERGLFGSLARACTAYVGRSSTSPAARAVALDSTQEPLTGCPARDPTRTCSRTTSRTRARARTSSLTTRRSSSSRVCGRASGGRGPRSGGSSRTARTGSASESRASHRAKMCISSDVYASVQQLCLDCMVTCVQYNQEPCV